MFVGTLELVYTCARVNVHMCGMKSLVNPIHSGQRGISSLLKIVTQLNEFAPLPSTNHISKRQKL